MTDPHATAVHVCARCGQTFEDLAVADPPWCPYCDRSVAVVERVSAEPITRVAVFHGSELDAQGFRALQTVRRTLLGMLHHGFITDFETYSRTDTTEWTWRPGSEEAAGIRDGLLDTLSVIAPKDWEVR